MVPPFGWRATRRPGLTAASRHGHHDAEPIVGGAWSRSRPGGAARSHRRAQPVDGVAGEDGRDQDHADHPGLHVGLDVRQAETVANVEHDQDGERDPGHRPGATEDADAAEQHHRDDVQLEAAGHVAADRSEPGAVQHAGNGGDGSRGDEQPELQAGDVERRVAGDVGVVADDVHAPSERRAGEHDAADDDADEEQQHGERERPEQGVLSEPLEPRREPAEGAVLDEHAGEAAQADQPGQRHDERRQPEPGDAPPLHQARRARRRRWR